MLPPPDTTECLIWSSHLKCKYFIHYHTSLVFSILNHFSTRPFLSILLATPLVSVSIIVLFSLKSYHINYSFTVFSGFLNPIWQNSVQQESLWAGQYLHHHRPCSSLPLCRHLSPALLNHLYTAFMVSHLQVIYRSFFLELSPLHPVKQISGPTAGLSWCYWGPSDPTLLACLWDNID